MSIIKTAEGWKQLEVVCVNHNTVEGVYRPVSHADAIAEAQIRADQFCAVLETGSIRDIKNFNGHRLYGAFGERL